MTAYRNGIAHVDYPWTNEREEDWRQDAACVGTDPEAFYSHHKGEQVPDIVRRLCRSCPVRRECLESALENDEAGYWGGTSERYRRELRRKRRQGGAA